MTAGDEVLRPALEVAIVVARSGEGANPPVDAPQALRGVLHFHRMPAAAYDLARRALDEDDDFRERVADEITEAQVGRAGWLYVTRPDGWEDQVQQLVARAERRDAARRDEQEAQKVARQLYVAQERLREAEIQRSRAEELADVARRDLADERQARRAVQDELEQLQGRVAAVEAARDQAADERDEAQRHEAAAEAARLEVEGRLAASEANLASASVPPPPPAGPSPEQVAKAAEAAAQADRLAEELHFLADEFIAGARPLPGSGKAKGAAPAPKPSPAGPRPSPSASTHAGVPSRVQPTGDQRRLAELPPGMMDGSPEAARHLLRLPGVVVMVDGYNVTKRVWADVPIAEQRRRLVAVLDDLNARTGAQPVVVFDGADVDDTGHREGTRAVQVHFSPAGVTADAVLVSSISTCPPGRPVVVVSSDNEVRRGAAARGARVLHSDVFLDVVRR